MILKNKKGSHVAVILSFVIFIGAIFFIYFITKPALRTDRHDSPLDFLETALVKNASENLTTASIVINQANPQNCVQLSGFFTTTGMGNRFVVVDSSNNALVSQIDGTDLVVLRNGNTFFIVKESNEFNAANSGPINPCQPLNQGSGYEIGLLKTSPAVFESRLLSLIGNYSSGYSNFKSGIKASQSTEFDFSFTYSNGTTVYTNRINQTVPSTLNIYARNNPIIYIKKNGGVEAGLLNIKAWTI